MRTPILFILCTCFCTVTVLCQKLEKEDLLSAVSNQKFTIEVQSMIPARGGFRTLSPPYYFNVSTDTIKTELPYMGRLYQPPMNVNDNGINFLSQKFDYKVTPKKKGGWDITLHMHDTPKFSKANVTILPNGNASIRISPNDRQTISYSGIVKAKP